MPVDAEDIIISPVSVPNRVSPGQMVQVELDLENRAPEIPNDEPNSCDYFGTGDRGLAVEVSATVGGGSAITSNLVCLLPSHSIPVTLEFQAPEQPGEYPSSFTVRNQPGDEPAVWDSYAQNIVVAEGGMGRAKLAIGAIAAIGVGEYAYRRYAGD